MANWRYTLRFKHMWNARKSGEITIEELGQFVSKELLKLQDQMHKKMTYDDFYSGDYYVLEELADCFKDVINVEEFDEYLAQLYDFADTYRIWIETF